ncbi:arylsulfatase B-like [Mizuhopecten yessoensis]|uniref:Arylsulfatase B n=1 Tax=Mizuhopecten yessoensis TaxID=6573 RepID=A0A210QGK6_MIZYE|nr:arylsulfatase B-like [Mizuhopecten yessoensis]OWF47903.1 Arylsulfatase B [Mizuhopecten yessoensis]
MEMFLILPVLCALTLLLLIGGRDAKQPNIVFMVADDYGWNDVGFRNPDMITPNIDKLAYEGVILNQSYVQPLCTPSRNAFMTGVYPFKAGLQHGVLFPQQAACSPFNKPFLPQYLKKLGYETHAMGKWHLGFCKWECTPTYRGFDSFYGFYQGAEDYYNRTVDGGKDFRDNKQPIMPDTTIYSTYVYADRARKVISQHDKSKPFYLYFPFQSVHQPIEVPVSYENMYSNIKNEGRRKYSGMVTAMDDLVGNVTAALKENGMYDDTLFIFTSDNGGWPLYHGNNYPLRGGKVTIYEGGTRATAFISGKGLEKTGYTYNGMMHAVDWMPTILSAAGGTPEKDIDGIDQWDSLRTGAPSKRTEFIYNLDDMNPPFEGHAAIRVGDYKLIEGYPGPYPGWYKPETETINLETKKDETNITDNERYAKHGNVESLGRELYNLKDDPYEHNDLSLSHLDIAEELSKKMAEYHKQMIPANFPNNSAAANPNNFDGYWSPGWC